MIPKDQRSSDLVIILERPKALASEAIGDTVLGKQLQCTVRVKDRGRLHITHTD